MRRKSKIVLFCIGITILFSACRNTINQEMTTEAITKETSVETIAKENTLVWRMVLPDQTGKEMIQHWEQPLNKLLREKGASYSVQIKELGSVEGQEGSLINFAKKVYGYDGIAMPLNAIPEMENSIVSCPLWGYLLLLYLSRFFISVFTLLFIFAAAVNRKNTIKASAILLAVLAFPVGMHILGISALDFYSFNCLYSVNMVFNQNSIGILTGSVGIVLLGGILSGYYLLRTMGRRDGKIKHVPPKFL